MVKKALQRILEERKKRKEEKAKEERLDHPMEIKRALFEKQMKNLEKEFPKRWKGVPTEVIIERLKIAQELLEEAKKVKNPMDRAFAINLRKREIELLVREIEKRDRIKNK
ncbi:hypothetical protein DRN74_03560 [Candidatus Micrarchaeota archaeon]|nr:MAG: hypothetical protein DRN74_03560 [Candidatus Micrarchaeota archaeon]